MEAVEPSPAAPSAEALATVAALRREYIVEALDGLIFQAEGIIRFLGRGEDPLADIALRRLFTFARDAAAEMNLLCGRPEKARRDQPAADAA